MDAERQKGNNENQIESIGDECGDEWKHRIRYTRKIKSGGRMNE
jgi:hypothetical protein